MFLWIEDVFNEILNLIILILVCYIDKIICFVIFNCEYDVELF